MAFKVTKKVKIFEERYPAFKEEDYLAIARKEKLDEKQAYKYSQFMKRRFPNERHLPYAKEWATRFKTNNPKSYMDSESLEAYNKVVESMY
jgi:hypothetical protein